MDLDEWEERAAIMEFDGGLNRFQAETAAGKRQVKNRWEFINAINKRNSTRGENNRQDAIGNATNNVSRMQRPTEKQKGQMPVGDVHHGRGVVELLALSAQGRSVL